MKNDKFAGLIFLFIFFSFPALGRCADCWLSVSGSGLKDGTDASNAYSARDGKPGQFADRCWKQTSADGIMHVLEGNYTVENGAFWQLWIDAENDGLDEGVSASKNYKKLRGEGKVNFEGPRPVPYSPATKERGGAWLTLKRGASNVWIENFSISKSAEGIRAEEGMNQNLRFHHLRFTDTRQNIHIAGHPDCKRKNSCNVDKGKMTQDIVIQNVSGIRYSKRHIRLSRGVSNVQVLDSHADSGLLDGDFAVGFDVENSSHDVLFSRCTSRNNRDTATSYWNGDGFKSENETYNIRWEDCAAFDNADAGFDIKTDNAAMKNIIALRNNRNIRIWSSKKSVIVNANASFSKHSGGESTEAGLWTQGDVECRFCTLHNNKIQAHVENNGGNAQLRFVDSILSTDAKTAGEIIRQEKRTSVDLLRTALWREGDSGTSPEFGAKATQEWEGHNTEFNSRLYGQTKGYHGA